MPDENFTIKEIVKQFMEDMSESIKELHTKIDAIKETTYDTKIQATKTNGRVNKLDEAMESMTRIIKSHDDILLSNTVTADANKKNNARSWKLFFWIAPFFFSFLGWVGYLYIEHVQRQTVAEAVDQTTQKVEQLLQDYKAQVNIN